MMRRKGQRGLTLLEILVAMLILGIVAVGSGALIRSLGLLGVVQFSPTRYERPARLRTLAMEYIQAEMEYLRNRPYDALRNTPNCNPPGAPAPIPIARRVPSPGPYLTGEPPLPTLFAAADIAITDVGTQDSPPPADCRLRRISVYVYLLASDLPGSVGSGGGTVFMRGETARSFR